MILQLFILDSFGEVSMYDYILIYFLLGYQNVCAKGLQLNIYEILKVIKLFIANQDLLLALCFQSSAIDQKLLKLACGYTFRFSDQGRSFHALSKDS